MDRMCRRCRLGTFETQFLLPKGFLVMEKFLQTGAQGLVLLVLATQATAQDSGVADAMIAEGARRDGQMHGRTIGR